MYLKLLSPFEESTQTQQSYSPLSSLCWSGWIERPLSLSLSSLSYRYRRDWTLVCVSVYTPLVRRRLGRLSSQRLVKQSTRSSFFFFVFFSEREAHLSVRPSRENKKRNKPEGGDGEELKKKNEVGFSPSNVNINHWLNGLLFNSPVHECVHEYMLVYVHPSHHHQSLRHIVSELLMKLISLGSMAIGWYLSAGSHDKTCSNWIEIQGSSFTIFFPFFLFFNLPDWFGNGVSLLSLEFIVHSGLVPLCILYWHLIIIQKYPWNKKKRKCFIHSWSESLNDWCNPGRRCFEGCNKTRSRNAQNHRDRRGGWAEMFVYYSVFCIPDVTNNYKSNKSVYIWTSCWLAGWWR